MQIADFAPQEVLWCKDCRGHIGGTCDRCHEPLSGGLRSESYHYHPGNVAGVGGIIAIHQTLCKKCYVADLQEVRPGAVDPFPPEENETKDDSKEAK